MTSPSDAEIRAALLRIVASEPFRNAPQLVSFLRFVVEKALDGQEQAIKGYTIATDALGRPEDFDPQADPIVRVEAGRLRRALGIYYAVQGHADPVRITIPRGTYVPVFSTVEPAPAPPPAGDSAEPEEMQEPVFASGTDSGEAAPPAKPALDIRRLWLLAGAILLFAVGLAGLAHILLPRHDLPWWDRGERLLNAAGPAAGFPEGRPVVGVSQLELNGSSVEGFSPEMLRSLVIDGLARFDEIAVIDLADGQDMPVEERYILNLRATTVGSGGVIVSRLTHQPSGHIVWSRTYDMRQQSDQSVTAETSIARQISVALAQPYGPLFADRRMRSGLSERMGCILTAYDYWNNPSREAHAQARDCLERVAETHPNAATVFANLAYLYVDEHRAGFNRRPDAVDRALQAARRAVEIAPESPRANQALMAALWALDAREEALDLGRRALELNPYDVDIMADLGARLVQIGRYQEGADYLRRAAAANPVDPVWYDFFLFLAAYMQEDFDAARAAVSRIGSSEHILALIARIAMAVHDREDEQAQALGARLVAVQPDYATDPAGMLAKRKFGPEIRSRLLEAFRQAGLRA